MARSWLSVEAERLAHRAALGLRPPTQPRWEEVRDLQKEGLDRAQIAEAMGIGERTVRYYEGEVRARERGEVERCELHGSEAQAESMASRYPDRGRQEWIRREMALRDELIEHKRRRGL